MMSPKEEHAMNQERIAGDIIQDDIRAFVVPVDIFTVPGLTIHAQMAYIVLRSHCNPRNGEAWPSYSTIAKEGRMGRSTAVRAVQMLFDFGLVRKEYRIPENRYGNKVQTSNLYTIMSPSKAIKNPPTKNDDKPKKNKPRREKGSIPQDHTSIPQDHTSIPQDHTSPGAGPEQNHLTDPLNRSNENNKQKEDLNGVLEDVGFEEENIPLETTEEEIQEVLNVVQNLLGSQIGKKQVRQLITDYARPVNSLIHAAQEVSKKRKQITNPLGFWVSACQNGWFENTAISNSRVGGAAAYDERYAEFFKLFPGSEKR